MHGSTSANVEVALQFEPPSKVTESSPSLSEDLYYTAALRPLAKDGRDNTVGGEASQSGPSNCHRDECNGTRAGRCVGDGQMAEERIAI